MARRRFGIRARATLASVLALTLTAIAFAVALVVTAQSRNHSDELQQRLVPASIAADDLLSNLISQQNRLRDAVTAGRPGGLAYYEAVGALVAKDAAQVARYARGDPPMTARLAGVTAAHQAWLVNVADPQVAALQRGDVAAAQAVQADTALVSPYVFNVRTSGVALQGQISDEQQAVADALDRAHNALLGALIAMIVVAAGATVEVIIGVRHGVLRLVDALAERERAEENLRRLFDVAPDAVIGVARDGSIVMANARAVELLACPAGELVGRPVGTLVPEDQRADLAAGTAWLLRRRGGPGAVARGHHVRAAR